MDIESKIGLVMRRPTEEVVTKERLKELFETKKHPKHYIGFEISGFAHIGYLGLMLKIKDFIKAGIKPTIFLADYHSWINKKLGGDIKLIQKIANGYFKHVFMSMGIDEDNAEFILASKIYDNEYWKLVIELANDSTLNRVTRATSIMGRKESESMPASFVLYPLMQAADIFHLDVDIMHAGMDQRKIHMLAIDAADAIKRKKPVAIHNHLLPSLQGGNRMNPEEAKMSKSKPESAVFLHESADTIKSKFNKAFCPEGQVEDNPVFETLEWLILRTDDDEYNIKRPAKFGGDITATLPELKKLYADKKIHPMDLKSNVAETLAETLTPVRSYFDKHRELIEEMEKARITR
jgi:tyrosyl-tRNA synthetase